MFPTWIYAPRVIGWAVTARVLTIYLKNNVNLHGHERLFNDDDLELDVVPSVTALVDHG